MAENNTKTTKKKKTQSSNLVGHIAQPTTLDDTTKLDVDDENFLSDQLIASSLTDKLNINEIDRFTTLSDSRGLIYQQIDIMFQDASVAAIARTYAQDVCEAADNGHIIWCESDDPKISKFVNYLLNVANIDKNIYGWAYNLIKYGDVYLKLFRESDYEDEFFNKEKIKEVMNSKGILMEDLKSDEDKSNLEEEIKLHLRDANDKYSYYIEMVPDPSTMFELVKYGQTFGFIEIPNDKVSTIFENQLTAAAGVGTSSLPVSVSTFTYKLKGGDIIIHQSDDYVHAFLDDFGSRFPEAVELFKDDQDTTKANGTYYTVRRGKSLFYDAYKIWREKQLLEASALLCRLTRSNIIQKVQVEMGKVSKEKSSLTLRAVKQMFETKTAMAQGQSMSEYTNPGPIINYIFQATREGAGNISVESIGGDYDPKSLIDLDWWNNRFYSAFGVPKQYFGYTDDGAGFNGGTSLTILSSVYSKAVKQIQNALIQAIDTAINLFLLKAGCKSYLNNFVLKMKTPLTQEEIDERANFANKLNAVSSLNSLLNDVDTKSRRLTMLKGFISTLHLGDDMVSVLSDEIKDVQAEEEKKKKEEQVAQEESNNNETEENSNEEEGSDISFDMNDLNGGDNEESLNVDMDRVPAAADTPTESFKSPEGNAPLAEEFEDDGLVENADLPTPEDLDDTKDFTQNE